MFIATVALDYNRRAAWSQPGHTTAMFLKATMDNMSRIVRVVEHNDLSVLPPEASTSWISLLAAVSDVCRDELFESRLLARDTLALSDGTTDLFRLLCDELGRRPTYDRMVAASVPSCRALENAVVFSLLPLLDEVHRNALAGCCLDGLRGEAQFEAVSSRSPRSRRAYCRRAATVIARHFGQPLWVERNYFTFPPSPVRVSPEVVALPACSTAEHSVSGVLDEFNALVEKLESSRGPLRGDELKDFKRRVLATPAVLAMVSTDPTVELCTLLHLAAAGRAHDHRLVEWLIQVGALDHQPRHFWHDEPVGSPDTLCNTLAVHSAAKRRLRQIVQHLVGADNFDTRTYHTKELLVQIAVKTDDERLCVWLCMHGADTTGADAEGKYIWQLATWRADLKLMAWVRTKAMRIADLTTAGVPKDNASTSIRALAAASLVADHSVPIATHAIAAASEEYPLISVGQKAKAKKKRKSNKNRPSHGRAVDDRIMFAMDKLTADDTENSDESKQSGL